MYQDIISSPKKNKLAKYWFVRCVILVPVQGNSMYTGTYFLALTCVGSQGQPRRSSHPPPCPPVAPPSLNLPSFLSPCVSLMLSTAQGHLIILYLHSVSSTAAVRACPRCREPVTFGGGMTMMNFFSSGMLCARKGKHTDVQQKQYIYIYICCCGYQVPFPPIKFRLTTHYSRSKVAPNVCHFRFVCVDPRYRPTSMCTYSTQRPHKEKIPAGGRPPNIGVDGRQCTALYC